MLRRTLAAGLLLTCLFAQTMAHAWTASITFDEGPHLAIGYATLRSGDFRLQPVHIHPPLANVLAAAPLLLQDDLPHPATISGWEIASLSATSDGVVWQYPHPRRLAVVSRLPIMLMALLLGAILYRWASDLFDPRAGLAALALYAFDPNVITHGSLVTTDVAVVLWGTGALFLVARYLRTGRTRYWTGAGIVMGLALASKVSAISLLPAVGLLLLVGPIREAPIPWIKRLLVVGGCFLLAGLVVWAGYGFEIRVIPGLPFPVPAATHVEIFRSLAEHADLGHPAFLWGRNSSHGWWCYFPVAFVLKTPLPTLLLSILALAAGVRGLISHRPLARPRAALRRWGPLVLFPGLYLASTFFSSVNIGYRHLLPLLPFLFIGIAGLLGTPRLPAVTGRAGLGLRIVCYGLIALSALATLRVAPHYLTFFNRLAGGPAGGYRYLVDSNLDWGQNLWQLREWMEENEVEQIYYAHFSPARPQVYGIEADFLPPDPRAVDFAPFDPSPGVYAIGASVLQGVYTPDVNTYAWFRSQEPVARPGNGLFIYRVAARDRPAFVSVCLDPAPILPTQAVRAGYGQPDLRVILVNCAQSWSLPPVDGQPAEYVFPPDAEPPPGATLQMTARHPTGEPAYRVYRVEGTEPLPSPASGAADGPLTYVGSHTSGWGTSPGATGEMWTWWSVDEVPTRPLSLMGHLASPDGVPIAVDDGLGVPIDQWQPGDLFVQRHRLTIPEGTPPGTYTLYTGAYWLDTMERWPVTLPDGTASDQILVGQVEVMHP